jgi:hypothetical protein
VPKIAKRCCYAVQSCATSMEALVIANVAPVAVFAGYFRGRLKVSNGHHPVLCSLVCQLVRAKMGLRLSRRGVAREVGLLSVMATRRGPDFYAVSTSHAICVGYFHGPLNSRVDSAIEHATAVFAGWVAWRYGDVLAMCEGLTQVHRLNHASLECCLIYRTSGSCGHVEGDSALRWAMCLIGRFDQLCVCGDALACAQSEWSPVGNWPPVGAFERVSALFCRC